VNILLANLYWSHDSDNNLEKMKHLHYPTGLAIIAGEIKRRRRDNLFTVDSYMGDIKDDEIFDCVDRNRIDFILLSMYLGNYQYRYLKRFINNIIRFFPKVTVIVGGAMASTIPEILLKNITSADKRVICVIGEGEETIVDLLNCLENKSDLNKVNGISYRDKRVLFTAERERIKNLDGYSRPAYDIFDTKRYVEYVKNNNRCWEISASRGCYGNCIYCKLVFGRKITMRSAGSVVGEMEDFHASYGLGSFNFVDDNFLNSERQVWDFYYALKKSSLKFRWRFQGRADYFSPGLAQSLLEVGLYDVSFGIESGSVDILTSMNKKMDLDKAGKNIKSLPPELQTHGCFIVGMPGETQDTIDQTIKFVKDVGLKHASAGILTAFPGTALYDMAKSRSMIKDEDEYCCNLGPAYARPYVNFTQYPDEQLVAWAQSINKSGMAAINSN